MTDRSFLFVPGNRPERFDKACAAGADVTLVDLEDAVTPADKAAAREALRAWLDPSKSVHVRINGADHGLVPARPRAAVAAGRARRDAGQGEHSAPVAEIHRAAPNLR